jgi:hypothetical protein
MMDGRLIGAARLQIIGADQLHVGGFGRRPDHLLLRLHSAARNHENPKTQTPKTQRKFHSTDHPVPPRLRAASLRWLNAA